MNERTEMLLEQADAHVASPAARLDMAAAGGCALVAKLARALRDEIDRSDAWRKALGVALHELDGSR
jgi:hypothetical protein